MAKINSHEQYKRLEKAERLANWLEANRATSAMAASATEHTKDAIYRMAKEKPSEGRETWDTVIRLLREREAARAAARQETAA